MAAEHALTQRGSCKHAVEWLRPVNCFVLLVNLLGTLLAAAGAPGPAGGPPGPPGADGEFVARADCYQCAGITSTKKHNRCCCLSHVLTTTSCVFVFASSYEPCPVNSATAVVMLCASAGKDGAPGAPGRDGSAGTPGKHQLYGQE